MKHTIHLLGFAVLLAWGMTTACDKQAQQPQAGSEGETNTSTEGGGTAAAAQLPVIPLGLDPVKIPADNPMTPAKVELGKMLYFDKRLSKDKTISCATCHDPMLAWAEHKKSSEGIGHVFGDRNSPTVINAAYMPVQFWDGRAASLEEQALGPIENPIEMGQKMEAVIDELAQNAEYKKLFKEIFGTDTIDKQHVAKAIAAFERTVLSGNSPYDKFKAGDEKALTEAQQRGMNVFMEKAACSTCHAPPIFSNGQYYNAGVSSDREKPDPGRMKITGKETDMGKFRVPGLREIAHTGPYFHDGSVETLEGAVSVMAKGGIDNPHLSASLKAVRDANLTAQDIADLVEFLKALSGEYPVIEPPQLP